MDLPEYESFIDERGEIRDLIKGERIEAITFIRTLEGAVRGNHYHSESLQITYLLSGKLLLAKQFLASRPPRPTSPVVAILEAGKMSIEEPYVAHAWKALEDSECLVFTRGPRSGNYEQDTFRLEVPLL